MDARTETRHAVIFLCATQAAILAAGVLYHQLVVGDAREAVDNLMQARLEQFQRDAADSARTVERLNAIQLSAQLDAEDDPH